MAKPRHGTTVERSKNERRMAALVAVVARSMVFWVLWCGLGRMGEGEWGGHFLKI